MGAYTFIVLSKYDVKNWEATIGSVLWLRTLKKGDGNFVAIEFSFNSLLQS